MKSLPGRFGDRVVRALRRRVRGHSAFDYLSASAVTMVRLAERRGYRLVGLESVLKHPRYFARLDRFEAIKDWKYETPE